MFTALKIKAGENEYTVKELSAPQGFVLDDAEYPVTMTAKAGTIQTMKVSDARLRGGGCLSETRSVWQAGLRRALCDL